MPKSSSAKSAFVSVAEASRLLDIAKSTAYGLIDKETFPVRVARVGGAWKVDRAQLEAFIAGDPLPIPQGEGTASDA